MAKPHLLWHWTALALDISRPLRCSGAPVLGHSGRRPLQHKFCCCITHPCLLAISITNLFIPSLFRFSHLCRSLDWYRVAISTASSKAYSLRVLKLSVLACLVARYSNAHPLRWISPTVGLPLRCLVLNWTSSFGALGLGLSSTCLFRVQHRRLTSFLDWPTCLCVCARVPPHKVLLGKHTNMFRSFFCFIFNNFNFHQPCERNHSYSFLSR